MLRRPAGICHKRHVAENKNVKSAERQIFCPASKLISGISRPFPKRNLIKFARVPLFVMKLDDSVKEFVAGTMGGWAQVVTGHPFDTIKVRLQTQPDPPRFRNASDCVRVTLKEEGFSGLYKGVTSPLAGIGICNAVLFTANGFFRRVLRGEEPLRTLSIKEMTWAGALSGGVMAFVNCPVELLKVRLQVQYSDKMTPAASNTSLKAVEPVKSNACSHDCLCSTKVFGIVVNGRFTMLESVVYIVESQLPCCVIFRHLPLTLVFSSRLVIFNGKLGAYEALKGKSSERHSDGKETVADLLLSGGFAGIAAWLVCFPQDVVKSRMQSNPDYKSTLECVRALVGQYKWDLPKYFKGFGPTMLRAFPANAATFLAYELTMKALMHDPNLVEDPVH